MSRTSFKWGIPLPWDPSQTCYVWFDALFNYCTALGYGDRSRSVQSLLAGRLPPRRQGHPPLPRGVLARDAHGRGARATEVVFAHGWLLVGGEKMSKTRANQIAPDDLVEQFGVDGFRYHFLRDQRFGPTVTSLRGDGERYNADLANNFGNLASRVLNMARSYCDGVVPDGRETARWRRRGPGVRGHRRHGHARLLDGFGAVWDLIRAANTYIEDKRPWELNKAGDAVAVAAGWAMPRGLAHRRAACRRR